MYLCAPLEKVLLIMRVSDHFSLPYIGLKDGIHQHSFEAGPEFFAEFDHSPVHDGQFKIDVTLDKRSGLSELFFAIQGYTLTSCDRCLAEIRLPVNGEYKLLVKVAKGESDEDEIIYISEDEAKLYLGQVIYEFICLSLPMSQLYDCLSEIPKPCNEDILNRINQVKSAETGETSTNVWNALKDFSQEN